MAKLYNLARMTTATTGTGTITLGSAVAGFLSFASSGVANGETVTYAIEDGANSEIGRGVYTSSGTTLTRSVLKSTNSDAAISLSGSAQVFITPSAQDLISIAQPGGRVTISTATPVLTSTVSAQTTVYYTPYHHRLVPLYDGTSYTMHDIGGELSQATTDSTKSPAACTTNSNYDLFVWLDGTTYRCTRGPAWSSSTSRGTGAGTTELERVQGIFLNKVAITNGPSANRGTYVGTIRTNGSSQVDWIFGALAAGGTAAFFGVWNMYNRINTSTFIGDNTNTWSYASTTLRSSNNSSGMRASYVCGLAEDSIGVTYIQWMGSTATDVGVCAIGVDSTSAFTGSAGTSTYTGTVISQFVPAVYAGQMQLGFHFVQALEASNNGGSIPFYGDNGTTLTQSGMTVQLRA